MLIGMPNGTSRVSESGGCRYIFIKNALTCTRWSSPCSCHFPEWQRRWGYSFQNHHRTSLGLPPSTALLRSVLFCPPQVEKVQTSLQNKEEKTQWGNEERNERKKKESSQNQGAQLKSVAFTCWRFVFKNTQNKIYHPHVHRWSKKIMDKNCLIEQQLDDGPDKVKHSKFLSRFWVKIIHHQHQHHRHHYHHQSKRTASLPRQIAISAQTKMKVWRVVETVNKCEMELLVMVTDNTARELRILIHSTLGKDMFSERVWM